MKSQNINYDENRNCFLDISGIGSDLIYGDLSAVKNPWLSYIIPVYKRADLLRETLESVLNQREVDFDWDVVLVDNEAGGVNDTERLVREINNKRILYYRNKENLGPDGNYNRCIELARGRWLAMLHGDDLIIDDHLSRMGKYIRDKEKGKKELAYISVRYLDFKDRRKVTLKRSELSDPYIAYRNRLKRYTMTDAVITGYSVALPSFGTVMNREVMIRTGGFNERFGICEDVITPYKLMKSYRVYITPEIMGFHRFEGNESIKQTTIFKICEAMTDFREYMFSRNIMTRVWGSVARTPFFDLLAEYCSYLSGFTDNRLKKTDFAYIYPERQKLSSLKKVVFHLVEQAYCLITGAVTFDSGIAIEVSQIANRFSSEKAAGHHIVIYGAGRAGRIAENVLEKKYRIRADYFATTHKDSAEKRINNVPVKCISDFVSSGNVFVLIATCVPEYFDEMKEELEKNKLQNYLALDKRFRTDEGE